MMKAPNIFRVFSFLTVFFIAFSTIAQNSVTELPIKTVGNRSYYYYKVKKGEQILQLADRWGISRNDIIKYNKKAADGLKAGNVLYFPTDDFEKPTLESSEYSENYITPIIDDDLRLSPVTPTYARIEPMAKNQLKVVVCLPFALKFDKPNKNAVHATDFYKGFLLGIDSLRQFYGNPEIQINVVDSEGEEPLFADHKSKSYFEGADIVIAPESTKRLNELAKQAKNDHFYVLNVFQTRDSAYLDNPFVLQGTTPGNVMYQKASDYFLNNLRGAVPVILNNLQGKNDKQTFVSELVRQMASKNIDYITINYDGALTTENLMQNIPSDKTNLAFIPTSSSLNEFQKFSSALSNFKTFIETDLSSPGIVRLFGYPEYIRFAGDAFDKLRMLNTSYYTRFYNDPNSFDTRKINNSYVSRYGTVLPEGVPNQVLYGFDVARWIISLATAPEVTSESISGVVCNDNSQMEYRFVPVYGGGMVNDAIYIVTLAPLSDIKKEIL